jgi:CRP/FNR family transcriptional regulator
MPNSDFINSCTISPYKCVCFEKLTDNERSFIDSNSVLINYKKGEVLFKQGGLASHTLFIETGLVKAYLNDGSNSLVLKIIPDGHFVGLSSISEAMNTYHYSAMTYVDSMVRQIDITAFKEILNQNAEFAKEVINIFSSNNSLIYGRFFCLTYKQSYGRMADILLCLSNRIFKTDQFELPLSRKDLADLSGMQPETAVRLLKKFNDEGLIKSDGRNIILLDKERLKSISEKG